jgi:hypothetical protein
LGFVAVIAVTIALCAVFGDWDFSNDPRWELQKTERWDTVVKTYLLKQSENCTAGRGYITTADGQQHSLIWGSDGFEEVEDLPEDAPYGWAEYTTYKNAKYDAGGRRPGGYYEWKHVLKVHMPKGHAKREKERMIAAGGCGGRPVESPKTQKMK